MADDPAQDLMLSALIRGIPIPAVVIGPDERIAAINGQAEELFDLKGQGRHYITALRQPSVLDAIEATLADGKPRTGQYFGTEGSKDTTWRVAVSSVPMGVGNGVLLGFENITLLEEAGQMRRDFVANVSHELRTPLTALLGFVETLKGPARDDAAARDKFLGIMESEAGRMARLVEDLLSLSRVEEDERVRPMAVVDLRDLISSTVDLISPLAETAGVALEIAVPDVSVEVPGDAEQLRQVLRNLVENAIKYGAAGGACGHPAGGAHLGTGTADRGRAAERPRLGGRDRPPSHRPADGTILPGRFAPVAGGWRDRPRPRHR